MRHSWLVLAVIIALAPQSHAGRAKSNRPHAARKADTSKKPSTRATRKAAPVGRCKRVLLETSPFRSLRVVGIVTQGRTQKALLMDASDEATTIMPGECVGVERVSFEDVVRSLREQLES